MKTDPRAGPNLRPGRLEPLGIDLKSVGLARSAGASIGKKYMMGWTGLLWCLFVLMHLLGNLGIYLGQHSYNAYSALLLSLGEILIAIEAVLVAALLLHLVLGVLVTVENWKARPEKYEMDRKKGGRSLASNTMIWTGIVVLVFLVLHVAKLKFGEHGVVDEMSDLYGAVVTLFQSPAYVVWYVVAVALLGLHVGHGLQSSLRTIGWNSERSFPTVKRISIAFGLLVAVGYGSIPLWAYLVKGGA